MKRFSIIGICIVTSVLVTAIAWFSVHRAVAGRPIVWDFRDSRDTSVIGWVPKGPSDTWYQEPGKAEIDFTLIAPGDRNGGVEGAAKTFHQTCWAIGCERSDKGKIGYIYAHFGHNIKMADALALAQQIIHEWNGGVEKPLILGGELPPDEWLKQVAAGRDQRISYRLTTGGVSVNVNMTGGAFTDGLNRTCNLTFDVGMRP